MAEGGGGILGVGGGGGGGAEAAPPAGACRAMTDAPVAPVTASRMRSTPLYRRLIGRPALGAVVGFVLVWTFFALTANSFVTYGAAATYLNVAAEVGVVASMVTLLLIGGEFDLSVGAMVGWSGM